MIYIPCTTCENVREGVDLRLFLEIGSWSLLLFWHRTASTTNEQLNQTVYLSKRALEDQAAEGHWYDHFVGEFFVCRGKLETATPMFRAKLSISSKLRGTWTHSRQNNHLRWSYLCLSRTIDHYCRKSTIANSYFKRTVADSWKVVFSLKIFWYVGSEHIFVWLLLSWEGCWRALSSPMKIPFFSTSSLFVWSCRRLLRVFV